MGGARPDRQGANLRPKRLIVDAAAGAGVDQPDDGSRARCDAGNVELPSGRP